jgi:AcrR family transcriptional regulator
MASTAARATAAPTEGRRERRRRELSVRIYEVARELFHEHGFDATTVEQIAERADIAPATFFNHFHSKSGVLALMTSEVVDYLNETVARHLDGAGTFRQRLAGLAEDAATQIQDTQRVARDVLLELVRTQGRPDNTTPYLARVHEPLEAAVAEAQGRGEISSEEDATFLAEMIIGSLNAALTNWLADPNYPISQRLPRAAAFVCDAIGAS